MPFRNGSARRRRSRLGFSKRLGGAIGCYLLCLAPAAFGIEAGSPDDPFMLSLQELQNVSVRSVNFFETSLARSPNNVKIISHADIEEAPERTLADFVQMYVPGAHIAAQGNNGLGFGARGLSRGGAARTLVMWNGHSLNKRNFRGYQPGYRSVLIGDLDRLEVVLGPGSPIHGTGALNGYVNMIPRSGREHQDFSARADYGTTDESIRLQAQYGKQYGDERHYYLYGGFYQARGFVFNNDFGQRRADPQFPPFNERVFDYDPSFKVSGNWQHDAFGFSGFFEKLETDPGAVLRTQNQMVQSSILALQPKYSIKLTEVDVIEIAPGLSLIDNSRVRRRRVGAERRIEDGGSESAVELTMRYQTERFERHKIALGVSYWWRDVRGIDQFFTQDADLNLNFVDGRWEEYATYFEDQIALTDQLSLTLGLRYDRTLFDTFRSDAERFPVGEFEPEDSSNVSPRAALNFALSERHAFRLSFQEGFKYPLINEYPRNAAVNRLIIASGFEPLPEPQAERMEAFEFGYLGRFLDDRLEFQFSIYHNTYKDPLGFVDLNMRPLGLPQEVIDALPGDLAGVTFNDDEDFSAIGGELSIDWRPTRNWRLWASYAYAVPSSVSEDTNTAFGLTNDDTSEWSNFPKHQVKAGTSYRSGPWSAHASALFQSAIERNFTPFDAEVFDDEHVRVNAGLLYRLNRNWRVSFAVKNLFKNTVPPVNSNPNAFSGTLGTDERLLYLGLRWQPGAR